MTNLMMRLFGKRAVHTAVGSHLQPGGALDVRFGFALLRDRRVPLRYKILALLLGAGLVGLLISLELPLEGILAVMLPFLGILLDGVADGLEAIVGPVVFASLILPFLVPRPLLMQLRAERMGIPGETVIDVDATPPPLASTTQPTESVQTLRSL
jgi:hypothetical protein